MLQAANHKMFSLHHQMEPYCRESHQIEHHSACCLLWRIMECIDLFYFRNVCWCCIMITTTQTSRGLLSGKKISRCFCEQWTVGSLDYLKRQFSQFSLQSKEWLELSFLGNISFLYLASGQLFPEATESFSSEGMSQWRKVGHTPLFVLTCLLTFTLSLSWCVCFSLSWNVLPSYSGGCLQILQGGKNLKLEISHCRYNAK